MQHHLSPDSTTDSSASTRSLSVNPSSHPIASASSSPEISCIVYISHSLSHSVLSSAHPTLIPTPQVLPSNPSAILATSVLGDWLGRPYLVACLEYQVGWP